MENAGCGSVFHNCFGASEKLQDPGDSALLKRRNTPTERKNFVSLPTKAKSWKHIKRPQRPVQIPSDHSGYSVRDLIQLKLDFQNRNHNKSIF